MAVAGEARGRVLTVRGPVIDVEFPPDELPGLNEALRIIDKKRTLILEVHKLQGPRIARTMNLGSLKFLAIIHTHMALVQGLVL